MYRLEANSFKKHIAWMLIHSKNKAIDCKINDTCIAWMLTQYKKQRE